MEWDDQLHCLRTGSLHSFEGDPSLREGCPCGSTGIMLAAPPRVAADPLGRCAAALVYGKHLAILPAIQADLLETLLQVGVAKTGHAVSMPLHAVMYTAGSCTLRQATLEAYHACSSCWVAAFIAPPVSCYLAILLQEGAAAKGSRTSASVGNSYLVQLSKMPTIKLTSDTAVRGMTFLHGYTEPVLLLLHESAPTWGGR